MGRALGAFVAATIIAAAFVWFRGDEVPPVSPPVGAVPDAAVPPPPPLAQPAASTPPPVQAPPLAAGFCPPPGESDPYVRKLPLKLKLPADRDEQLAVLRSHQTDPAAAWELAMLTRHEANLDEPIDALATYLAVDPAPALARLKARLEVQRDIQRDYRRVDRAGLTVLWPPQAITDVQIDELTRAVDRDLDDAARLTGTRHRQRLTVVVHSDRSELLAVSCMPSWTTALYDGQLHIVATGSGFDRASVKHETLHAQLAPLAPKAPRWFHEGVAQSFARQNMRMKKWVVMVRTRNWIPFSSLEGSFGVFEADADAELAYAQSYAMVELMRELGGDASIPIAMKAFEEGADAPATLARACKTEVTGQTLLDFMERRLGNRAAVP